MTQDGSVLMPWWTIATARQAMVERIASDAGASTAHKPDTRTLYLDLIAKVLTNTIYGDANLMPTADSPNYDPEKRALGLDWPAAAHSMIGTKRMNNLRQLCERVLSDNIPGDLIETGVWRGGACIMLRAILKAYGDTTRKVYCADSFAGLPKAERDKYPQETNAELHQYKELAISREQVASNFDKYGLLDEQVVFVEGFFADTLPKLSAERFALLRLDGDMYSSTIQALDALYPKLSPGGFIIVDDYNFVAACRNAVEDYRAAHGITDKIETIDWAGVYWRKSAI